MEIKEWLEIPKIKGKMRKLGSEHLKAILPMAFFSIIGALLISTGDFLLILGGIFCIIMLVSIEMFYTQKIAFKVKKIDKELQKSIQQAKKMIEAMLMIIDQMTLPKAEMPQVISNIYKDMEKQSASILSDLKKHCEYTLSQLSKKFEKLELRIKKLEKSKS